MDELLQYLKTHSGLAKGVGLGTRSNEIKDREWNDLATRLNAHGRGATKTGQRWKRYWADLKFKSKNRAALRRREADGTDGGPATLDQLSETDRKILAIIGEGAVYGDIQHKVPAFPSQSTSILEIENPSDYHDEVVVNTSESPPPEAASFQSPFRIGRTSRVYTIDATEASRDSPPLTPRQIRETTTRASSVSKQPRSRNSNRVTRAPMTSQRVDPSWVVELEQRRVDAECQLADAAAISAEAARLQAEAVRTQAEAARTQAEAARLQAEASLSVAQALHEHTLMLNKMFDLMSKK